MASSPPSAGPATQDGNAVLGDAPLARDWTTLGEDTPLGPYRALAARPSAGFEAQREAEVRTTDER
ncbi:MAG: hypothetical protein LBE08_06165, partial [Bifidobacteriaceae bacterium]|nr:hypothetical protein [Bifidobacteriaceae bacterium]